MGYYEPQRKPLRHSHIGLQCLEGSLKNFRSPWLRHSIEISQKISSVNSIGRFGAAVADDLGLSSHECTTSSLSL